MAAARLPLQSKNLPRQNPPTPHTPTADSARAANLQRSTFVFGNQYRDMELRPAVKVAGVTHMMDIRTLYDLHIKPTLKKEIIP